MGTEFLNRTRKTITKHIDTQRAALATPELFTTKPGDQSRSYIVTLISGVNLAAGEFLIAEARNGSVKMRRGHDVIGLLDNPTIEMIAAINNSGGAASGVVQRIHKLSGKADVTLC